MYPNPSLIGVLGLVSLGLILAEGSAFRWLHAALAPPPAPTPTPLLELFDRPPDQAAPDPLPPPPPAERPRLEVVFVLDTTGSMGGMLQGAKDKIWSIASRLAQGQPAPDLRVGLVGFRDRNDAYVTRVHPLTDDLDQVHADLSRFRPEGGGDTPEDVGQALHDAVTKMQWSNEGNVLKLLYLVGDAPPKRYPNGPHARTWVEAAAERGIVVSTVQCGRQSSTQAAFEMLAERGGGSYIRVRQDGGMAHVDTPYDDEIGRLEREASGLATYGGAPSARREVKNKLSQTFSISASALADRASYMLGKGRSAGALASPKLDDAVDLLEAPEAAAALGDEELPADLAPLSPEQRKVELGARKRRRTELQQRIEDLAAQRAAWMERNARTDPDAMDGKVLEDVASRSHEIGVSYE